MSEKSGVEAKQLEVLEDETEERRRKALEAQLRALRERERAGRKARFWKVFNSRLEIREICKLAAIAIKIATAPKADFVL